LLFPKDVGGIDIAQAAWASMTRIDDSLLREPLEQRLNSGVKKFSISARKFDDGRESGNDRVTRKQVLIYTNAHAPGWVAGRWNELQAHLLPNQIGPNLLTDYVRRLAVDVDADGIP